MRLFHLVEREAWAAAAAAGEYAPASLAGEGFVHLSTAAQVPGTLARFFAGREGELVLLVVEGDDLGEALRWDDVGHGVFPHLYRALRLDEVVEVAAPSEAAALEFARPLPEGGIEAARTALIVVDMQRFFADMAVPILARVTDAVDASAAAGAGVVLTQHGHAEPATDGGMLGAWWGDLIVEGSPEHELLRRLPADLRVAKRRYSAFVGTGLEGWLRGRGVTDVAICGVITNLCVESTARDAFMRDFRVCVLRDAVATAAARPQLHAAALANLAYGFAHVPTVAQWAAALR